MKVAAGEPVAQKVEGGEKLFRRRAVDAIDEVPHLFAKSRVFIAQDGDDQVLFRFEVTVKRRFGDSGLRQNHVDSDPMVTETVEQPGGNVDEVLALFGASHKYPSMRTDLSDNSIRFLFITSCKKTPFYFSGGKTVLEGRDLLTNDTDLSTKRIQICTLSLTTDRCSRPECNCAERLNSPGTDGTAKGAFTWRKHAFTPRSSSFP